MPYLIAIGGHTGTGKSTLAYALRRAVAASQRAVVMEEDHARRELLGYDLSVIMKPKDYTEEVTQRVRAFMDGEIMDALTKGQTVIDASGFFSEGGRQHIEALAVQYKARFVGLWLVAEESVLRERLEKRFAQRVKGGPLSLEEGHASDACPAVLDKFGELGVPTSKAWMLIKADGPAASVLEEAKQIILAAGDLNANP